MPIFVHAPFHQSIAAMQFPGLPTGMSLGDD